MKNLRKFALDLDREGWGHDYGYDFYLKSRCLCNFIERKIKKDKLELVDSTKIVIVGRSRQQYDYHINSSQIACYYVPFDKVLYDKQKLNEDIHNFIIQFATNSLKSLPETNIEAVSSILEIIKEFKLGGFKNQWTHQKKSYRKHKIVVSLDCVLTLEAFELKLNATYNKKYTFSKVILQTDPDEIAFHYKFKDIKIENNKLIVTSRVEKPLVEISIKEFINNKNTT